MSKKAHASRVSPSGMWGYSRDFLDAATKIQPPPATELEKFNQNINLVAYYLLGHSIELSLKAFLLCRDLTIVDLESNKYGHKLLNLCKTASKRKLGLAVKLNRHQKKVIDIFSDVYSHFPYKLRYFESGTLRLPKYPELYTIAKALVEGLKDICEKKTCQALHRHT